MTRRGGSHYLLIFAATFIVRALAYWFYFPPEGWRDVGYGFELGRVAAHIANGYGMSSPFEEGFTPTSWFMPAVPVLWAAIYSVFGIFSNESLAVVYLVEALVAALTAVCWLWLLQAMIPGGTQRRLPLFAVLIAALLPEHFVSFTRPWYWGFQKLGVAVILVYTLRWYRDPTIGNAISFGIASGLTLLVNSVPLLLCIVVLLQAVARSTQKHRMIRGAASALGVCSVMLSPWVLRNFLVHGGFVPFRQNTWVEIRQGNNPHGLIIQGINALHPNVNSSERARYRELGETGYEARARQETIAYVLREPTKTLKRTFLRAFFFWICDLFHEGVYGERTWSDKSSWERCRDVGIFVMTIVPIILTLVALCFGWLREVEASWILTAPLISLPLPYFVSHIHPTYFSSVRAFLIIISVIGVAECLRNRARRPAEHATS